MTERWALWAGIVAEQRPLSINADANVKLNHYRDCGASTSAAYRDAGLQPQIAEYFGDAEEIALSLQAGGAGTQDAGDAAGTLAGLHEHEQHWLGTLDQLSTANRTWPAVLDPAQLPCLLWWIRHSPHLTNASLPANAGTGGAGCDAHLTCARETAKRSGGVLDEKNVCGAVCSHGVPVKQLFMTCPANENFTQYVAMLAVARLLGVLPEMEQLLLDINCQFSKHLAKRYPHLAHQLGCHIGWLHAKAGHNLECQLEFNAMFAAGLGRCFGEGIEQLWVGAPRQPLLLLGLPAVAAAAAAVVVAHRCLLAYVAVCIASCCCLLLLLYVVVAAFCSYLLPAIQIAPAAKPAAVLCSCRQ